MVLATVVNSETLNVCIYVSGLLQTAQEIWKAQSIKLYANKIRILFHDMDPSFTSSDYIKISIASKIEVSYIVSDSLL